jgi:hypothetical protein
MRQRRAIGRCGVIELSPLPQRVAEVVVRRRVSRPGADRLPISALRIGVLPLIEMDVAEVGMRIGETRIGRNGVLEGELGFGRAPHLPQHAAQQVVCPGVAGRDGQGLSKTGDRIVRPAALPLRRRQQHVRLGALRRPLQEPPRRRLRLRRLPLPQQPPPHADKRVVRSATWPLPPHPTPPLRWIRWTSPLVT